MKTKLYKLILNFLTNKRNGSGFLRLLVKSPLIPPSAAVSLFSKIKRGVYRSSFIFKAKDPGIFVISFGNITMGGSGKTPFSCETAEYLYGTGLKPCVISRGYKGRVKKNSI